jgi:hypothetical protein
MKSYKAFTFFVLLLKGLSNSFRNIDDIGWLQVKGI